MQGVTRKRRLCAAALEPTVELESIRTRRQRKRHFREDNQKEIQHVQQQLLARFPCSVLSLEQLREFPFLCQGRQNCCTVVSVNHLAYILGGTYDNEWRDAYARIRQQVAAIDSLSTMYRLYGHRLVPGLKIVDLRETAFVDRLNQLQRVFQEQLTKRQRPVLVDAAAHTSLAIAFDSESQQVLFVDTYGNTTEDGGLWVVKLPLLAALCKEVGFIDEDETTKQTSTRHTPSTEDQA